MTSSSRTVQGLIALLALAGVMLSSIAVSHWAPDAAVVFPSREEVLERAAKDAEMLGYRVAGKPRLELSAGSRAATSLADIQILVENQPNAELRRRLLTAAPPIRLGVRFFDAVGGEGVPDTLLLEYDGAAELMGAGFAADRMFGLRPVARPASPEFADRVAAMLLGRTPPEPQDVRFLETIERVYSPGGPQPAIYVSLSATTRWLAYRQPIGAPLLTYTAQRFATTGEQVRFWWLIVAGLLALGVLLWRLTRRRAGFGRTPMLAVLLAIGLLPSFAFLTEPQVSPLIWLYFLLTQVGVLLVWTVGEAELREVRGRATEHYDRLLTWRPIRATGSELLLGFGVGCALSGLRAAGGELAARFGGGYSNVLAILPDQWTLSSPLGQGLALAAATSVVVGLRRSPWPTAGGDHWRGAHRGTLVTGHVGGAAQRISAARPGRGAGRGLGLVALRPAGPGGGGGNRLVSAHRLDRLGRVSAAARRTSGRQLATLGADRRCFAAVACTAPQQRRSHRPRLGLRTPALGPTQRRNRSIAFDAAIAAAVRSAVKRRWRRDRLANDSRRYRRR